MTIRTLLVVAMVGWPVTVRAAAGPLDEAQHLLSAAQYEDAVRALEPIVAANPYEGMAAYYLGVALARSGRCPEAMPHFAASLALGANGDRNGMRSANLRMAECRAQMGDAMGAAARVREAWARWSADDVMRLTAGEAYAPLRAAGLLTPLTGRTPEADAGGPAEQMRADLAYFDRLIRETHPNPFHYLSEPAWRAAVAALDGRIHTLDAAGFNLEMMRLGARVGDGHTSVFPASEGPHAWRLLPFYPLRLADGWVIAAAPEAQRELVGARIEGVDGRPIEEVFAQIRQAVPGDNERTALWLGGVAMQTYEAYAGFGLAREGAVAFDLVLASGERRSVRLEAGAIDRNPNARWAPADWPDIGGETLWLADPARPFSTHWLADEGVLYVQLNQVADAEGRTMAEFGAAALGELREKQARGLVLDLRHSQGYRRFGSTPHAEGSQGHADADSPHGTMHPAWEIIRRRARTPGVIPARVRLLGRATAPRPFADTLVRLVRYQARQTMPAHSHDWFGLTLVLAGTLEEAVEERTAVCGPLTLILKPAGSQHATRVGPEGALTVHFELSRSAVRTLVAHRLETRVCAFYLAGPAAGALLELLAPREGCRETCIAGLLADVVAGRAAASPPVDTAAAAEFGRGVLGGSTGASAAALGMHRVSLARAFRREMGVAPCLWRMQQRLSRAAGALAAGEESAACIADAAGFSDQAHLCRLFRRETGLTPGRYRALVRYLAGERSSDAAGR